MQETISPTPTASTAWTRGDYGLLLLLILFALGLRGWQIAHTEVAARDSIGFIRIAWRLHQHERSDWSTVIRQSSQHPLFPLTILATAYTIHPFVELSDPEWMTLSAQLASSLAAVLLIVPTYALGRLLFDRRVAFSSALLVQCLPVSGRLLADGLSEATFLLLAATALYWSARALRTGKPWTFAMTGVFGALAYLTRPEGLLVVVATGTVLLVGQLVPAWRLPVGRWLRSGVALGVATLLLAGPFIMLIGGLSLKPAARSILKNESPEGVPQSRLPLTKQQAPFAVYEVYTRPVSERTWWAIGAIGKELIQGSFYVGWFAAILGIYWFRRDSLRQPGAWVMLLLSLGIAFALWRVAVVVGYVSDRHTLLILLCGSYWACAGLLILPQKLAVILPRWRSLLSPRLALLLPLVFALSGLPKTMQPLHEHRSGFREAGLWLATHAHPADEITDPLCWAHYYAGRVFQEETPPACAPGQKKQHFVVLEEAGNPHTRLPSYERARLQATNGQAVYRQTIRRGRKHGEVVVYCVPTRTP